MLHSGYMLIVVITFAAVSLLTESASWVSLLLTPFPSQENTSAQTVCRQASSHSLAFEY